MNMGKQRLAGLDWIFGNYFYCCYFSWVQLYGLFSIIHLNIFIWIYMLGIVPLILIKISDIKFTSLIEFELDCVPYIDVLLVREVGLHWERCNWYFQGAKMRSWGGDKGPVWSYLEHFSKEMTSLLLLGEAAGTIHNNL